MEVDHASWAADHGSASYLERVGESDRQVRGRMLGYPSVLYRSEPSVIAVHRGDVHAVVGLDEVPRVRLDSLTDSPSG